MITSPIIFNITSGKFEVYQTNTYENYEEIVDGKIYSITSFIREGSYYGETRRVEESSISRLMRRTRYQAKLGRKLDNINRKVMDNNIRLSGQPTDMLRIKVNRDPISNDLVSRTIISTEIIPVIFPNMEKVPLRRLTRDGELEVLVPNLYQFYDDQYWTLYTPAEIRLDEDDLLLRLIYDPYSDEPNVISLQVKEINSIIGYNSIIWFEVQCTLYDESLPTEIIEIIKKANIKRDQLGW